MSKADFYSSAKKTFIGNFNYFVMPSSLYEEVKEDVPAHIGVIAEGCYSIKKAKRMKLAVEEKVLKDSLIRSLSREAEKLYKSENPEYLNRLKRLAGKYERESTDWRKKYTELMNIGYTKYGRGWYEVE